MRVFQDALDSGVDLDEYMYLATLQGLAGVPQLEEMSAVYRQYLRSELDFSLEIFECMLGAHMKAENYSEVQSMLDFAKSSHLELAPSTFLLLVDGCIENELYEQALVYMSVMRENFPEFEPTREFYDKILANADGAITLSQIMLALGVDQKPVTMKDAAYGEMERGQQEVEAYLKELAAQRGEEAHLPSVNWEEEDDFTDEEDKDEDALSSLPPLPPITHYPEHPLIRRIRRQRERRPTLQGCLPGMRPHE